MATWMKVLKASEELKMSASKISRLIKKKLIQTRKDPLDERATLVDIDEIRALLDESTQGYVSKEESTNNIGTMPDNTRGEL